MGYTKRYNPEVISKSFMPAAPNIHILDVPKIAAVPLTAAQLIAMEATPVSILPAPAANMILIADEIVFEMIATATAFTGGGAVSLVYHGGSVAVHTGSIPASVVTTGTPGTTATLLGPDTGANGITVPAGTGVDITNATAPFASGSGTAVVFIRYRNITLQ